MKKQNNFHNQRASLQYELHNVLLSWKQHKKVSEMAMRQKRPTENSQSYRKLYLQPNKRLGAK